MKAFRNEVKAVCDEAKRWFIRKSISKSRKEYFAKGKLCDNGKGAVYVYFKGSKALYVGEAGRPIKRRMHDKTSPHKDQPWFKEWTRVRFVNLPERTDRLTLELFLILAYKPKNNVKPGSRSIGSMFKT